MYSGANDANKGGCDYEFEVHGIEAHGKHRVVPKEQARFTVNVDVGCVRSASVTMYAQYFRGCWSVMRSIYQREQPDEAEIYRMSSLIYIIVFYIYEDQIVVLECRRRMLDNGMRQRGQSA